MFAFHEEYIPVRIKIIGVGDFGAKMVNYSNEKVLLNVNFAVIATKNETLLNSAAPQRLKVEDTLSEKSTRIFSELIADVDLLFIFTDLTDENISEQIAELSKSYLTVAIVPESAPNKEKFQNSVDALISVETWHKKNSEALEIDLEASRRRRQGIGGLLMNIPALFNDDLHYKDVSKSTVSMISNQSSGKRVLASENEVDLFREDVRLIAKDGKLYYLPQNNLDDSEKGDEQ